MKTARDFYDAVIDCEGDIQGTLLVEARDREVRAAAPREAAEGLTTALIDRPPVVPGAGDLQTAVGAIVGYLRSRAYCAERGE